MLGLVMMLGFGRVPFYEILYLMFEAEAIISFMVWFLVEVTILIEVPSRRYEIRHRCGDLEV